MCISVSCHTGPQKTCNRCDALFNPYMDCKWKGWWVQTLALHCSLIIFPEQITYIKLIDSVGVDSFIIHLHIHPFIHSFMQSCIIHSFIPSSIHSCMNSLIHTCIHAFIHHPFIHPFIHSSSFSHHSFIHPPIHHSFIHLSFIHPFWNGRISMYIWYPVQFDPTELNQTEEK